MLSTDFGFGYPQKQFLEKTFPTITHYLRNRILALLFALAKKKEHKKKLTIMYRASLKYVHMSYLPVASVKVLVFFCHTIIVLVIPDNIYQQYEAIFMLAFRFLVVHRRKDSLVVIFDSKHIKNNLSSFSPQKL